MQKKKLHVQQKQKNNARTHRNEKILQFLQNAYDAQGNQVSLVKGK